MKHSRPLLFLLILALLLSSIIGKAKAARPLAVAGTGVEKDDEAVFSVAQEEISWDLKMGLEGCDDGVEECMKRRIMLDAHLDYIYTQHLKP